MLDPRISQAKSDQAERPAPESTWRRFNGYGPSIAREADRLLAELQEIKDHATRIDGTCCRTWSEDIDERDRLRAENERLRHGYCDEAYILMVQALDVKALPKGRRRILTEQAVRMAKVGLSKGWPRYQMRDVERRAEDVLRAHAPEELSGSFDEQEATG